MSENNTKNNCVPPISLKRNEYGLICDGNINYVYNEDGTINWREMIDPEFIKPNREKTDEKDITKLKDTELIILLGGLKKLAKIRGYSKVEYETTVNNGIKGKLSFDRGRENPDLVLKQDRLISAICKITWVPNYETGMETVVFSSTADATVDNTNSFMTSYLMTAAENRSFARCIRNFLGINIVADEELGDINDKPSGPYATLVTLMDRKGLDLEKVKEILISKGMESASGFTNIEDIPKKHLMGLTGFISKIKDN